MVAARTNVVCLIKYDDRVLGKVSRDQSSNLWIDHVVVAEHNHVGVRQHVAR